MIKNLMIGMLLLVAAGCSPPEKITMQAKAVEQNTYFTWGIDKNRISIPVGSILTNARLVINNPSTTDIYVSLLDNPSVGHTTYIDTGDGNVFLEIHITGRIPDSRNSGVIDSVVKGSGMSNLLPTTVANNIMIFDLSKMNDRESYVWDKFPQPVDFGTNRPISISSSYLLQLIDFMATGNSFGLGIDADSEFTFDTMMLELTIQSFEGNIEDDSQIFIIFNSQPKLENMPGY